MSRISAVRSRSKASTRRCRPRLERLEERWVPSTVRQFDFGKPGSPLRAGYVEVSEATSYSPTTGYGWLPGATRLESRDRGVGDALTRDFVLTRDGTFAIDLPNGRHSVTLTAGDEFASHGIFVFLEGKLADSFTTHNGEYLTRTYTVDVQDGRLEVRLKEQGMKLDDNAVINLLEINTLADPIFDRFLPQREPVQVLVRPHGEGLERNLTYTLLPGNPTGARIDAKSGLLQWTPGPNDAPGNYFFRVLVKDTADPTRSEVREFTVTLQKNLPRLFITSTNEPHTYVDAPYQRIWQYLTSGSTAGYTATVNYGDGTIEGLTLDAQGRFTIQHFYASQGTYPVSVAVWDASGALRATGGSSVVVLPKGARDNLAAWRVDTARPGETASAAITITDAGANPVGMLDVQFANNGETATDLFVAWYPRAPVETARKGTFFDINLTEHAADGQVVVRVTLPSEAFKGNWDFGYFTPDDSNRWVKLRDNPALCDIELVPGPTPGTTTMVVTFKVTHIFKGTVFTVSLPTAGDTTTGTIRPPQASTGNDSSGQTRTLSFTSNAQLSLALTASRDNQLSVSSTGRGSQAGESSAGPSGARVAAALSATAGVGGNRDAGQGEELARDDGPSFWRWLQSDEGMLELWLNGIDPMILLQQSGGEVAAQAAEELPAQAVFETSLGDLPELPEPSELAQELAPDGEPTDLAFIGLAFLPALLAAQSPRRGRRRGCGGASPPPRRKPVCLA